MTITVQYPIYLITVTGGYASVVDTDPGDQPVHLLAVFLEEEAAASFMATCNLLGTPRELGNAREFRWLLQSLRHPVTQVAFDPSPDGKEVSAKWRVAVDELLAQLIADRSPWNYPVFVIAQNEGFVSIDGSSSDDQPIKAVGLFTTSGKADTYLQATEESGTVLKLADMEQARSFLAALKDSTPAVALDPVVDNGQHIAKICFRIEMLLDKYLVESNDDAELS